MEATLIQRREMLADLVARDYLLNSSETIE